MSRRDPAENTVILLCDFPGCTKTAGLNATAYYDDGKRPTGWTENPNGFLEDVCPDHDRAEVSRAEHAAYQHSLAEERAQAEKDHELVMDETYGSDWEAR
jgi:hypothetical protein